MNVIYSVYITLLWPLIIYLFVFTTLIVYERLTQVFLRFRFFIYDLRPYRELCKLPSECKTVGETFHKDTVSDVVHLFYVVLLTES